MFRIYGPLPRCEPQSIIPNAPIALQCWIVGQFGFRWRLAACGLLGRFFRLYRRRFVLTTSSRSALPTWACAFGVHCRSLLPRAAPVSPDHSLTNLIRLFSFPRKLIGKKCLFHADVALRCVLVRQMD